MDCKIRKVEKDDNLILALIIRGVFEEHDAPKHGTVYSDPTTDFLFELFQKTKSILWVAELENKVVGCCGIYPTPGLNIVCTELVKFYLQKDARGKGIGKELINKCIESAIEFGYSQLYLESLPQFSKAIALYEKAGFLRLENPLGDSKHKTCSIWMLKEL